MTDTIVISGNKPVFRANMSRLSFSAKVNQVIDLQERLVPIYASRGIEIRPWTRDEGYNPHPDEQAVFCEHLRHMIPDEITKSCERVFADVREMAVPQHMTFAIGGSTHAN